VLRIYEPDKHHRVPRYVRGVVGTIDAVCGQHHVSGLPDQPIEPLYTVRFSSTDVWGPSSTEPPFAVFVDLWQSRLEAISS
jgi:nitrile hydratase